MRWVNNTENHIAFDGLDVYASWSLEESGAKYLLRNIGEGEDLLFPVLIELNAISIQEFYEPVAILESQDLVSWKASISVPQIFLEPPDEQLKDFFGRLQFVTAVVRKRFFQILQSNERLQRMITSISLSRSAHSLDVLNRNFRSQSARLNRQLQDGQRDIKVVVGVIDDGIAFGHEAFRRSDTSTRIERLWIQSDPGDFQDTIFGSGREIAKKEIDTWLAESRRGSTVDEDEIYRRAGVADFSKPGYKGASWRAAHGTHVLDLAAGARCWCVADRLSDGGQEDAPDWPIVCVQLPVAVTADTSGATLAHSVIEGLLYILLRSAAMVGPDVVPPHVVVNLSYGFIGGQHDGNHPIERAIRRTVDAWESVLKSKARIVIAAGNHHLARLHAKMTFNENKRSAVLPWRVHPGDRTPSHVEIWLPPARDKTVPVRLSVSTPGDESTSLTSELIGAPGATHFELVANQTVIAQAVFAHAAKDPPRGVFRVTTKPTDDCDREGPGVYSPEAPAGLWRIKLVIDPEYFDGNSEYEVHAWVQRDDTLPGFPTGARQSYFDDPFYERYDEAGREILVDNERSIVQRSGTINALATGNDKRVIVIGGLSRRELSVAKYSARGPTLGERVGPDALAVSDDSLVLRGVLAAGTRSGSVVAMNGTSVAAPAIARLIAQDLARNGEADRDFVRCVANAYEQGLPGEASTQANPQLADRKRILVPPAGRRLGSDIPRPSEPCPGSEPGRVNRSKLRE